MSYKNKRSTGDIIFDTFNVMLLLIIGISTLYPFLRIVAISLSAPYALTGYPMSIIPKDFTLESYASIMKNGKITRAFINSSFITVFGTAADVMLTVMLAYPLSKKRLPYRDFFTSLCVFTMFFSGGLIPTFLVMRDIGLYNTRLVMILMGSVSVWNLMVARTYIQTSIPHELYEAAMLDGASHFDYFFRCVIPLSKTIIAVLVVYYGVAKWNDYFTGLVYLKDRSLLPLQTVLREILATLQVDKSGDYMLSISENAASMNEAIRTANVAKYCIIVIATGPVVILYAFLQKYFEKGIMIGSLKG